MAAEPGARQQVTETIAWTREAGDLEKAAHFFSRTITGDDAYISHGEIQQALSLDGVTWARDLEARFLKDMREFDADQHLLLCRDAAEAIIAAAIVSWDTSEPDAPFGTLEDLAVAPAHRSTGLGARMTALVEAEARERKMKWLFLESGKNNVRAHAFFERHGFKEISHVFAKKLA